ncbi:uncharacterized protein LOC131054738 isoform X2 [Cryptomeria japonica]|uniref:uncharacterized protein LOC131054738 isoform X2 n=1 Tax=Cryptomeria japonica TaxID=3369 RepID=UPI0025AC9FA4|nr:uncharacterized protein LOC131054738 isoform X2 [Cryptomeria japonica]
MMFTEGLDSSAINWVRKLTFLQGVEIKRHPTQAQYPTHNMDPVYNDRSGSRGFGLPPSQLRSAHVLSGPIPNPRSARDPAVKENVGNHTSEYEETSDSGGEREYGRYSGDSSPQEDQNGNHYRDFEHGYNGTGMARRSMPPTQRRETYTGDYLYSYGNSSLRSQRQQHISNDLPEQRNFGHQLDLGAGEQRYPYSYNSRQQNEYIEDESSESGMSFEEFEDRFPRDHVIRQGTGVPNFKVVAENIQEDTTTHATKSRSKILQQRSSEFVPQHQPTEMRQDLHNSSSWPGNLSDMEMPSAPPIDGSMGEPTVTGLRTNPVYCSETSTRRDTVEADIKRGRAQHPLHNAVLNKGLDGHDTVRKTKDEHAKPASVVVGDTTGNSCKQSTNIATTLPTFHLSGQGAWHALIAYEACVRLCLQAWARGCVEAPEFLHNECTLLRNAFGLQQILLQPEEELLRKGSTDATLEGSAPKPKKTVGKIKVQVRKVRMVLDSPSGCTFHSFGSSRVNFGSLRRKTSNLQSTLLSGWEAVRKVRVAPHVPLHGTYTQRSMAYMQAGGRYVRQVSSLLKTGVTSLRSSSVNETTQETYSCYLKLKSSIEEEAFRMQPGSGEMHVFLPESPGDDLIVEVQDSKGNVQGRVLVQLASISDDPVSNAFLFCLLILKEMMLAISMDKIRDYINTDVYNFVQTDKTRWWSIYKEPEHECVGKIQLFINYITSTDEMGAMKCGPVAETVAYDLVLEVAMRVQHFQQRNLHLHGPWRWLLTEFASYYGVSDAYTKLRYLSSIMEAATPTEDCLILVHDLLVAVVSARDGNALSRQEKRILGDIEDQVEQLLALVFENYKSLDDSIPSGLVDVFGPATGIAAPALTPAVKIYTLLHDILSPEVQLNLCSYFQTAVKKRSRRHIAETDEFVANGNEGILMDALNISTAYSKMKTLCLNIRNEVSTDIEIHNQHILPSSIDLPNIAAAIYNVDLCNRLRAFLIACPPSSPAPPVGELVIATADFQRDIASWNISPVKGGVDAKELFHLYIVLWIQDRRLLLLESCKLDKVRSTEVTTQHSTSPFVEDMYERIKDTLNEYEIIVRRWPEYTFALENAIADVEKAVLEALEKQYADVLAPLKENTVPKKFGLQYVQKLTKRRSMCLYSVPSQLGVFLNTIKRLLDVLRPKIEAQLKSWVSCLPEGACGNMIFGEHMSEITVMLRAKFKNYLQAIIDKLADNTQVQRETKIKKIIQDTKDSGGESEIRDRMQALNTQLIETISNLHDLFTSRVFVAICRGYWDRMGQDVLHFLENRKENRSLYKGSRITVGILDDTFASQIQRLQGHALQEKDLEPPRSIMEVRSMLCKDAPNGTDSSNYYYF